MSGELAPARRGVQFGPTGGPEAAGPFAPRQLARIDEALTLASRESGLTFSLYVGELADPTGDTARRMFGTLADEVADAVLVAVSPGQRVVHVVTGTASSRRLPDRACALAVLGMQASFTNGDLTGGMVSGLRMLADAAGPRPV